MLLPHWLVKTLCVACFILNAISILLCLSALTLILLVFLKLEHLFGLSMEDDSTNMPYGFASNHSIWNGMTNQPTLIENDSSPKLTRSKPIQFSLVIYLMFYLVAALLGVFGATTRYRRKKVYLLIGHVLLLFTIICFNLVAWFEFRSISPLSSSPYDDIHLLIAALFDFIDLLIALCLLAALFTNKMYIGSKHRNSIGPIEENGQDETIE